MTLQRLSWLAARHARALELAAAGVAAIAAAVVLMAVCARAVEFVMGA